MKTTHVSVSIHTMAILYGLSLSVHAAVVMDGSLGQAGALDAPAYQIDASLGHQQGANLFHSFSQFSLSADESATFSGPESINNIVSRVTGGELSTIDGQLISNIPGANLYLFNPAGVLFGENANVDIGGSLYVSTAHYLNFTDGSQFSTQELNNSQFSTAQPSAFGFIAAPQTIDLNASQLELNSGKTLHFSGGDININNSNLRIQGGTLALHSGASSGEVDLSNFTDNFSQHGSIQSQNSEFGSSSNALDNAYLIANTINLVDKFINLVTVNTDGGLLHIQTNDLIMDDFSVFTATAGSGIGANVEVQATGTVQLQNQSLIISGSCSVGCSQPEVSGNSGFIEIQAEQLNLSNASIIDTSTVGNGNGGNITIKAKQAKLTTNSAIASSTQSSGNSGTVYFQIEDSLFIQNNAQVQSATSGTGNAQGIQINTNILRLSNPNDIDAENTVISSQSTGSGQAGNISIQASKIEAFDGARITSSTFGEGNAGDIFIETQELQLSGVNANNATSITSSSRNSSTGHSGSINIQANKINLLDGANIGNLTEANGNGGNIDIQTTILELSGKADINSESRSIEPNAGNAGNITLTVTDKLSLASQAKITTASKQAGGGQISINNQNLVYLNNADITTSVQVGSGNGGDITISKPEFVTLNKGRIVAQAIDGNGGNIFIRSDQLLPSTFSLIDASSQRGVDGQIIIDSPSDTSFNELVSLPSDFLQSDDLSRTPCSTQTGEQSRFLIRRREGMPNAEDDWLPSDPIL